jgi:hypothetical protein
MRYAASSRRRAGRPRAGAADDSPSRGRWCLSIEAGSVRLQGRAARALRPLCARVGPAVTASDRGPAFGWRAPRPSGRADPPGKAPRLWLLNHCAEAEASLPNSARLRGSLPPRTDPRNRFRPWPSMAPYSRERPTRTKVGQTCTSFRYGPMRKDALRVAPCTRTAARDPNAPFWSRAAPSPRR